LVNRLPETSKNNTSINKKNFATTYASGYALGLKFIFILTCPIAGGFSCGFWLDRQLDTLPWFTLILIVAGLVFAIYAVYRVAINLQEELNQGS